MGIMNGLRPASLFKADGKKMISTGLLVKDVVIWREMSIDSRRSLFCCVSLIKVHLGSLGYFKIPFANAVRENNYELDYKQFGDRPVFCRMRTRKGLIVPTEVLCGNNSSLCDKVSLVARIPRAVIAMRSERKGHATGMCLCFISYNHSFTKEQLVAKLVSHGNWKSKEASKYIETFLDSYCCGIVGQFEYSDQRKHVQDVVENYPYAIGAEFDFLNYWKLPNEVQEEMLCDNDCYQNLKRKHEAANEKIAQCEAKDKLVALCKACDKYNANARQHKLTQLMMQCDLLNVQRFNSALNQKKVHKLPPLLEDQQVIDLAKAADVAAKCGYQSLALVAYGPHRTLSNVKTADTLLGNWL